jgi:ribonucleoside-diphosphate reductase alpha chain
MSEDRESVTKKLKIGNMKGFITVGLWPDGTPGEVFLVIKQMGSFERGLCHALALMISLALQYGVPLEKISEKLTNLHFEPQGVTGDPQIPFVSSIADYIGKWLALRFLSKGKDGKTV